MPKFWSQLKSFACLHYPHQLLAFLIIQCFIIFRVFEPERIDSISSHFFNEIKLGLKRVRKVWVIEKFLYWSCIPNNFELACTHACAIDYPLPLPHNDY